MEIDQGNSDNSEEKTLNTVENRPTEKVADKTEKKPGFKDLFERLKKFWSSKKNRLITISVIGGLIIIMTGLVLYKWYTDVETGKNEESKTAEDSAATTEVQELAVSILDGTMVPKNLANRHPLAVIIENHTEARPQSGVSDASIVYEAIAEGGITRYLALYSGYNAAKIGPVRSARTYFVDFSREYNAYLGHVGGNYDALEQIRAEGILDLDQFQNAAYYKREAEKGISSEHTVYTSTDLLYELAGKKGYSTENGFTPLKFKTDVTTESRPASQKIIVNYGSASYKVTFDYDPASNNYLRTLASLPDQDRQTGKRLSPKNVILQTVSRQATTTKINEKGYIYTTEGQGKAQILQDGKLITGSWQKSGASRTKFLDGNGQEISLNPGQTWICIVHPDISVSIE